MLGTFSEHSRANWLALNAKCAVCVAEIGFAFRIVGAKWSADAVATATPPGTTFPRSARGHTVIRGITDLVVPAVCLRRAREVADSTRKSPLGFGHARPSSGTLCVTFAWIQGDARSWFTGLGSDQGRAEGFVRPPPFYATEAGITAPVPIARQRAHALIFPRCRFYAQSILRAAAQAHRTARRANQTTLLAVSRTAVVMHQTGLTQPGLGFICGTTKARVGVALPAFAIFVSHAVTLAETTDTDATALTVGRFFTLALAASG